MARLLNTYQLWLDDLFPKAKFADGLVMVEKVGHKKQLQMMRREWIDEGKPKPAEEPEEIDISEEAADRNDRQEEEEGGNSPEMTNADNSDSADRQHRSDETQVVPVEPDEDELDALLAESGPQQGHTSLFGSGSAQQAPAVQAHIHNDFEDEEEAMAGMDW